MRTSENRAVIWSLKGTNTDAVLNALGAHDAVALAQETPLTEFCKQALSESRHVFCNEDPANFARPSSGTILLLSEISSLKGSGPVRFEPFTPIQHIFLVGQNDGEETGLSPSQGEILFEVYCELYKHVGADQVVVLDIRDGGSDEIAACLEHVIESLDISMAQRFIAGSDGLGAIQFKAPTDERDAAGAASAKHPPESHHLVDAPDYYTFFSQQALLHSMRRGKESLLCLHESENTAARILLKSNISADVLPQLLILSSVSEDIGLWVVDHAVTSIGEIDVSLFDLPIVLCGDQFLLSANSQSQFWQEIFNKFCVSHCFGSGDNAQIAQLLNLNFTKLAVGKETLVSAKRLESDIANSLADAYAESRDICIRENPKESTIVRNWYETYNQNLVRNPGKTCLSDGVRDYTLAQLNQEAITLAEIVDGTTPGSARWMVIFMERSAPTVIAMASALRLGRPFLEIPSWYSRDHVELLVSKLGADLIVTSRDLECKLEGLQIKKVTFDGNLTDGGSDEAPIPWQIPLRDPGHIGPGLLTSGTTGVGKVAAIPIEKYLAFHDDVWAKYIKPNDKFGLNAWLPGYIFHPIFLGATGVVVPDNVVRNPYEFTSFVRDQGLSQIVTTPTMLESILTADIPNVADQLSAVHTIWISGEKPSRGLHQLIKDTLGSSITILDYYGSNEAGDLAISPFGEALQVVESVNFQIIDDVGRHVPKGAVGNLYLNTPGLFSGYASDAEETKNSFIADPLAGCYEGCESTLYKTGDLARSLGHRKIEITGRSKHQTKLRGFKVVFKNVEDIIANHPGVAQSIVAVDGEGKSRRLISIIVPSDPENLPNGRDIRDWARGRLPFYSVPTAYFYTDKIPFGFTQKRDDRLLPALDERSRLPDETRAKTEMEFEVAKAWRAVLGDSLPELSSEDDFYEFGGSLSVVELIDQLNTRFKINITLSDLTANTTLRAIAELVDNHRNDPAGQSSMTDIQAEIDVFAVDAGKTLPKNLLMEFRKKPGKKVLLTGATGYLGSTLMISLARQGDVSEIFCLVRKSEQSIALSSLCDDKNVSDKITPIVGNLSNDFLGLSQDAYLHLIDDIDFVVHAAAEVNWIKSYSALKAVNVHGTWRVLNCALDASAPIVFLSTLAEDTPSTAYNETKLVAEGLCRKMSQSAFLPVSIVRCGDIAAPSSTYSPYLLNENDYVIITLKACLRMGIWPKCPNWSVNLAPVDYIASIISHLVNAAPEDGFSEAKQVLNPTGNTRWMEMFDWLVQKGGQQVLRAVSLDKWQAKIDEFALHDPFLKRLKTLLPYIIDDFENPPDHNVSFHPPTLVAPCVDDQWLLKVFDELSR